ncbi:MAG: uridine kinase [Gemmatimonadales bacterium]|jgi:uridine kinase|nr:uridine kinase [Gemmatimonadales bacterium]
MAPVIIGVAGGSGSGKTTVVEKIVASLGANQVSCIQHDSYYYDRSTVPPEERVHINYDHPDALETPLLVRHLELLKAGQPVNVPVYDFAQHSRTDRTEVVYPRRVVILEGILILADRDLRRLMDIMVFVDTDADIRILRRMDRDIRERGRDLDSVVDQYLESVRPMHLEFVEPSKRYAHIIIPEGGHNRVAVDMLITKIQSIVGGSDTER